MPNLLELDPATAILVLYSLAAGVLLLLGIPLYFGKIPPNSVYGFRTRRTLADENLWYAVNRVAGRGMLLTGAVTLGVASWVQWQGFDALRGAKVNLAVFVVGVLITVCQSVIASRRAT